MFSPRFNLGKINVVAADKLSLGLTSGKSLGILGEGGEGCNMTGRHTAVYIVREKMMWYKWSITYEWGDIVVITHNVEVLKVVSWTPYNKAVFEHGYPLENAFVLSLLTLQK